MNKKAAETTKSVVGFIYGVIGSLLGLRFVFRLFDANPGNGFVEFIYDMSSPLIAPFETIFNNPEAGSGSVFDSATLVAVVVYGLAVYLVLWAIRTAETPREVERKQATNDSTQSDVVQPDSDQSSGKK